MPIRQYICEKCSIDNIELLVGINEKPICETCQLELKQVIESAPRGFVKNSINPVKQ